ncbi:hypothetical protein SAMN05444581_105127 [Methylocapsa palsarum]|uniref:Phage tail tape measure protein, TP901 family, core region n=2 Tax=Methylocapsa palsarum TaxID=1612308 RepID=A0A1I3YAJ0_9HYPH|nr:hypothetical protein SAMN05444581_105127 [Methylocapsa palsarum]
MQVYEIYTRLSLENRASAGLAALAKDVLHLEGSFARLEKTMSSFSRTSALIFGGLGIAGGVGIGAVLKGVADYGDKLLDQQDKLQRNGMAANEVLKLQADYYNQIAKAIPTSTAAEYLKTANELRAVTGTTSGAAALAPRALMVDALLSNSMGKQSSGEYYKLLRSAEMKGISTNPERLKDFTDKAFSYITAFGGKLTANDFQLLARRGGTAFMNADIDKALGPLSVLAADLGGSGAGTTAMTLQQLQMGASTLSKQQAAVMADAGLLDLSKTTKTGFGGGRLQLAPGAMKGSLEHAGDLPGWIKDVIYPALMKMAGGDEATFQNLISKFSPNRNSSKLIEMFGNQGFLDQQMKDMGLAGQVKPIEEAYKDFTSKNPKGVKEAFGNQFESMMQSIGAPLMQAALPIMKSVTEFFEKTGAWANAHPDTVQNLGIGFGVLGGAIAGLGAIMVTAAVASMIGPLGIPALAIAIGTLGAFAWKELVGSIKAFGESLAWLWGKITSLGSTIGGLLHLNSYDGGGGGSGIDANLIHKASLGSADLSGGAGVSNMNPEFRHRLAAMMAAGNASGHSLSIKSGWRSQAHQNALFANSNGSGHWVARHSNHTRGIAADLGGDLGWAHQNAGRFGLKFPMPWEKWHVEPQESRGGRHVAPYRRANQSPTIENVMYLDGEEIHRSTTRRMVAKATHPTQAPYHDGASAWTPPDAGLVAV